jgi:excisionase family DNA binding protein
MALMEIDLVLTTDEATRYLRISKPTFLKYIHLGRIKAIKAGKGWRVLHSELYRFMKGELLNEMFIDANSNKNET